MPISRRPLALAVDPVETRSTIASASPRRGVASTEPETGTSSARCRARRAASSWRRDRPWRPKPVEIGDRGLRGVVRHRGLQRAARESELGESDDVGVRLDDEVRSRYSQVHDAVLDVLRDVTRADEQEVDGRVGARDDERPLGRLEREPGIGAEPQRRLGHAPLGRDGQREPTVLPCAGERAHRRFARSSATR